ncbi:unnamed protein product [Effrenium voratum]|nr:unnamed protein product [Effrenium voratum]
MRRTASPYAVLQSLQRFRVAGGHVVAALSALQKCAAWERALLVLRDVRNDDPQRLAAYNSTISACERSGRWPWALHLHHDMPRAKLVPDVISYSAGISACDKSARWQAALGFLAEMRARRVRRDKFVCGASISACVALLQENKKNKAERKTMKEEALKGSKALKAKHGRSPTAVELQAALSPQACGKATIWSAALHLLGCGAAEVAMCAAISLCQRGTVALGAAPEKLHKLRPGSIHLLEVSGQGLGQGAAGNGAISACGDARQWQLAFDLLEVRLDLSWSALRFNTSPRRDECLSDKHPHILQRLSAAISACHWDMAVWLYADMRRAAISPDTITFNALLQCTEILGCGRRWQVALALLWDMERLKVQKNLITAAASQKLCEERQMPKTSPQNAPRAKFSLPALLLAIDHGRPDGVGRAGWAREMGAQRLDELDPWFGSVRWVVHDELPLLPGTRRDVEDYAGIENHLRMRRLKVATCQAALAVRITVRVGEAYDVLHDPSKRNVYDKLECREDVSVGCLRFVTKRHLSTLSECRPFGFAQELDFERVFHAVTTPPATPVARAPTTPTTPTTPLAGPFGSCAVPRGATVVLHGFSKTVEHNGCRAKVQGYNATKGRYDLMMDCGSTVCVRPENMTQRCTVAIHGLTSRPELNGQSAEVLGFDAAQGRYLVALRGDTARLRPSNAILGESTCVRLQGLNNNFNGRMGRVLEVDRRSEQYDVECGDGQRIRVKYENALC